MPLFGDVFLQTGTADGRTQQKTQKMISPPPYLFLPYIMSYERPLCVGSGCFLIYHVLGKHLLV